MLSIEELEKRIIDIENRNQRVEADKCWETSVVRRLCIAILTYIVIVLFFFTAQLQSPFVNAIVPTLGFLLSTLTVGVIKKWWIER
ncbi:MAG: hypothetical protein COV60_01590 [Candidatus Magasanikbacteria bacterium CG11_big_fil_rev_8_21_14_0_20_43_7]|uniref:Uncharacterized protein n=1 Tax=Candidatus Magasanikbacteria bacterium CG11_big_fil_rev_8_21_14_0_20_43_7 TaxID=1974654 RepID=A0A2H0N533_9BACT|nr:MAG: hypothetical protein COV60_01590 [Candidatus Magasanikbacteria bacterium CG11_big_fil_rev_8_21_14_0_20_43_7]